MERESIKVNIIVAPTGGLVLSIQHIEGYFFMDPQTAGDRRGISGSYKGASSAFALVGNEHNASRLARRPRMILPMSALSR